MTQASSPQVSEGAYTSCINGIINSNMAAILILEGTVAVL